MTALTSTASNVLTTSTACYQYNATVKKKTEARTTIGPLFDSHCHIGLGFSYGPEKEDPTPTSPHWPFKSQQGQFECEEQFIRAVDTGVNCMTLIGIDASTSERVRLISRHLNSITSLQPPPTTEAPTKEIRMDNAIDDEIRPLHAYWTAGIHPHSAHLHSKQFPLISELVRTAMKGDDNKLSRLVAIGETGMDFFKSRGSFEDQRDSLVKHLQIAKEFDLPIIIHAREADSELYNVLRAYAPIDGVIHCFSSDVAWMQKYLDLGFYISFTNNITYSRSKGIQDACSKCPIDRIVIETDSPFLPPQRARGQVNEPANTRDTFEQACKLRGIWCNEVRIRELQTALWKNTSSLFKLPHV